MTFLRILAFLFGLAFLVGGVMGFLPQFVTDGKLFGYFEIGVVQNITLLTTAVFAFMGAGSVGGSKSFFKVFGLFYGTLAIFGFVFAGDLYFVHLNMADNILHSVVAVISLYFGFVFSVKPRLAA